jgi:hypothetical protein
MSPELSPIGKTQKGFANVIWMVVFAVIAFIVLGLVVTYGSDITQDVHDDQTANSYAANASAESLKAQSNIAEKQGTMGNVVMAGAIIAILLAAFGGLAMGGRK